MVAVPASSLAERYRIDGVLAEGGMATVYRAWHCLLDQPVALKMLRPEYSSVPEIAQRFLHEARAMARLRSKHAARVMDFGGTVEGNSYMVLEFLNGKDLQQRLAQQGAQPVERAVEFVLQAADAVAEAHATGLVHRDIKPANLFLAKEDGTEIIKVIDFGISKSLCKQNEFRTLSKSYLGSPQYMSPEQIRSAASVDERTDIWSLGVVLYELLTGRRPVFGSHSTRVVRLGGQRHANSARARARPNQRRRDALPREATGRSVLDGHGAARGPGSLSRRCGAGSRGT